MDRVYVGEFIPARKLVPGDGFQSDLKESTRRFFDIFFRGAEGKGHWRSISAEDFFEAELVSYGVVPMGVPFSIHRVSESDDSYDEEKEYSGNDRLFFEEGQWRVEFFPEDPYFSLKGESHCGEW